MDCPTIYIFSATEICINFLLLLNHFSSRRSFSLFLYPFSYQIGPFKKSRSLEFDLFLDPASTRSTTIQLMSRDDLRSLRSFDSSLVIVLRVSFSFTRGRGRRRSCRRQVARRTEGRIRGESAALLGRYFERNHLPRRPVGSATRGCASAAGKLPLPRLSECKLPAKDNVSHRAVRSTPRFQDLESANRN